MKINFKKVSENKYLVILGLILIVVCVLHCKGMNSGKYNSRQETVVVSGESETQQTNEVASFSAGVNVIKENKDEAVTEVNEKINALITSLKEFGIDEKDIQTQSANVYEQQETDKTKKNQWVVNNTIQITLKDVAKANDLMNLLNKSGANNIYGPSFSIENTNETEKTLYDSALTDAKEKAELIAEASGRKLGKIVNVVDGNSNDYSSIYYSKALSSGTGGADLETGSSTISKTLTVTFEFK